MREDIVCPFCKDHGFDLIGLKHHLTYEHCTEYRETMSIGELIKSREVKALPGVV